MALKIGFDIDGVLARTDQAILAALQAQGHLPGRTAADIWHHAFEVSFPEVSRETVGALLDVPGFYQGIAPCPQLSTGLERAVRAGAEVWLVTAREGPTVAAETAAWLRDWRVRAPHVAYVPARGKAAFCVRQGLAVFVEDRPDTAQEIAAQGVKSFLVEMPYSGAVGRPVRLRPRAFFTTEGWWEG